MAKACAPPLRDHLRSMTETQLTAAFFLIFPLVIWGMVVAVRSAKVKKTGSTLIVAAMFGFVKLLDPRQVDVEEARHANKRRRGGENGSQKD